MNVKPVSKVDGRVAVNAQKPSQTRQNQFSSEYKIARVNDLLRSTNQFAKWEKLCHENVDLAVKTADIMIERHGLLEKSRSGILIDWGYFDRLTEDLKTSGFNLYRSHQILKPPVPNNPSQAPFVSDSTKIPSQKAVESQQRTNVIQKTVNEVSSSPVNEIISDDNLLVMNLVFKPYVLSDGLIGYVHSDKLYLPMGEIADILDFNAKIDDENGIVKGWFISEDRTFSLDIGKKLFMTQGKEVSFKENVCVAENGEVYVDSELLSKIFPVRFDADMGEMSISLLTNEKLPFQARLERENLWNKIGNLNSTEARLPREFSEYKNWEPPMVDISAGTSYTRYDDLDDEVNKSYAILSKGDLARMSSEIFLSGNERDELHTSRLTLERKDPDFKIGGNLKASHISLGDIRTPDFPILSGHQYERGVHVGNKELNRPSEFDKTSFEGGLPPGWDVEVYRNNVLINSQRVGEDGRYVFNDIPVYYGNNNFRLEFYGPQGQRKVEEKNVNVGNEMLKKGKGEYDVALTQKNTPLFDFSDNVKVPDENSIKFNATYAHGINDNLTIGGGISSQDVYETRRNYLNIGAIGNFGGYSITGDYIHDTKGGDAIEGLVQTKLGPINIRVKEGFFFNDFHNDAESTDSDLKKYETDLSLIGMLRKRSILPDVPFSLTYRNIKRVEDRENYLNANFSAGIGKVSLNHNLGYRKNTAVDTEDTQVNGHLQVSSQFNKVRVKGQWGYELEPDEKSTEIEASGYYRMNDRSSSEFILKHDFEEADRTTGTIKYHWNNGKFILSPEMSYSSDKEFAAKISLNTTLGVEPRSGAFNFSSARKADGGGLSAKVFLDKNLNNTFDEDEQVLEGVNVRAVQGFRDGETGENGVAFITGLQKHLPTDVVIDRDTLEDPFWEPVTDGHSILPRPGHIHQMDIPIINTGEIDGTIFKKLKDGGEKPFSNVTVQLVDAEGNVIQQTKSEYDGFYIFMKVPPGDYSVRIDPDDLDDRGLSALTLSDIDIDPDGNVLSDKDILLVPSPKEEPLIADAKTLSFSEKQNSPVDLYTKDGWVYNLKDLEKTVDKVLSGEEKAKRPEALEKKDRIQLYKDGDWLFPEKSKEKTGGKEKFGLHLTSYRTPEKAVAGIKYLQSQYNHILNDADYTIRKVDLGSEKGIWYRVIAGSFENKETAGRLGQRIKMLQPYCRVLPVNNDETGVHLTSFRTRKKAELSVEELKNQYPGLLKDQAFTIKRFDLGKEKGEWERVIAGKFRDKRDAEKLARKIKLKEPYCLSTEVENTSDTFVHIASFKSNERAALGLKILQNKYKETLKDKELFLRRVDLGNEKGVWYRILISGFEDEKAVDAFKKKMHARGEYAETLNY